MQNHTYNRRISVQLSPVELIWLHSQHLFQKIEQNTMLTNHQIKFYKNNTGAEIKYLRQPEDSNLDVILSAKQQLQKIINDNQIRLMNTSLHKDIYVKISRQARKQFPKTYIIFLHYQTFENCCKKLRDKFAISSILPEFEKLQKDNPFFCFLIAQKNKIDEVQNFTNRILNSEVSCASTTFSNGNNSVENSNILFKKTMSVSSLRGSFTSHDQPTEIQHYRLSVHSQDQQEIFEVNQIGLADLSQSELENLLKNKIYFGCRVYIHQIENNYLTVKKTLYYANRFQLMANPHVQPIYAYSMKNKNLNKWKLTLVTDKAYSKLSDLKGTIYLHSIKNKLQILTKICKCLLQLHKNRQSYGDINEQNILLDESKNIYLSSIINKKIPPYTNPLRHDIRQYLLLIYRFITDVQITSECLNNKFNREAAFCTLANKCKNKMLQQFLLVADELFMAEISLEQFYHETIKIIHHHYD